MRGVYRVIHHALMCYDVYAASVALVGSDIYLYEKSVLALCELVPTNSYRMFVATPRRVRRNLPDSIIVIQRADQSDVGSIEGIPSQTVLAAIRSCKGVIMKDRLADATRRARELGYIRLAEEDDFLKEFE